METPAPALSLSQAPHPLPLFPGEGGKADSDFARAIELRVNDVVNPVGTGGVVYFGWQLVHPLANQVQSGYQILVASTKERLDADSGDVWDSGRQAGSSQNHVAYGGKPLASNTRYFWKVRYWDGEGNASEDSESATFDVGLLTNEEWAGALWIRRESEDADDYTYYRKTFLTREARIVRAMVFVSAVHKYELWLNGTRVGTGPSYHYPQCQYYNAYDITAQLGRNAQNVFALFTHWFGAGQGRPESERGVILKAVIEYADGMRESIGTDASWKQTRAASWVLGGANRNHEGVGYVETIDARRMIVGWAENEFDDAGWEHAREIGAMPTAPWTGELRADLTRIVERGVGAEQISRIVPDRPNNDDARAEIAAMNSIASQRTLLAMTNSTAMTDFVYVVDLGQVYAGRPRIEFSGGEAGAVVTVRGGYVVGADGLIDASKNQETDMTHYAVLSGESFTFLPCEYLGMRYVQIENAPMPITHENFSFVVRHVELDGERSAFESSNATLNAVWELCKRSVTLGAQEQFLDTPTREKGGFLVDSLNESLAAMMAYGERVLTRKTLLEFLDSMEQYWSDEQDRGRMNAVYPNGDGVRDIPDFTQAFLVWVWAYYLQTGDRQFLRKHFAALQSIADYGLRYRNGGTGLVENLRGGGGAYLYGIMDWPPSMRYGYDTDTAARTVVNCYAYADCEIVGNIAAVLGETTEAEYYRARAEELKRAINTHLLREAYVDGLHGDGTPSGQGSQQANMFPLALRIVPEGKRAAVLEHVKRLKMSAGMVTVYWLVRALGEASEGKHLLELYTNAEWDGWAKNLAQGATCTWESWDADKGGNLSQSHPWGAVGLCGIQEFILGVTPLAPQYERVRIKPLDFGDGLQFASGRVPTERGDIVVRWERSDARFELVVELPVNVRADVWVPLLGDGRVKVDDVVVTGMVQDGFVAVGAVGSGTHRVGIE